MASSVYIHIPFCKSICSYCDFCKFLYNEKWVNSYLIALKSEINDRYLDDTISTIYIGGGTPSSLTIPELRKLFDILSIIKRSETCEFTFECNIEDITEDLIVLLKYHGVNRLSIGIESFQENVLKFMNRTSNFQDALKKLDMCRNHGINNINIDLIYAVPGQTLKDLSKDLNLFLKLKPTHISTYSLIIEENTKLYIEGAKNIDEELDYLMFKKIEKKLKHFNHYEISNFALPNNESLHNLTYWNNLEYYGFGLGASGYITGIRYDNTKSLNDYLKGNIVLNKEILSQKEKMDYEIMLGLRKLSGINKEEFFKKYNISLEDAYNIKPLLKNKYLVDKLGNIFIHLDKLYVMNEILIKLI
ncbi:MAG: radical SAM family heme chaperone HemW [Bacilli bacterium]